MSFARRLLDKESPGLGRHNLRHVAQVFLWATTLAESQHIVLNTPS
jgi:hypothetical protein